MIPFNFHHLYYFFAVAKAGSVSKACEKLRLAQPTVSAQLKQFEGFLGRRLFERRKQRLFLTEEGRTVLDYAESIFELGQELQDTLKDRLPGGRRSIQIGILLGTPRAFTHALLCCLLQNEPGAHVVTREAPLNTLLGEMDQQHLDLILTDVPVRGREQGEYANHLVGRIPIVFATASSLARRYRRFPKDLNGAPLILPSAPSQVYQQIQAFLVEHRIEPLVVAEVQDVEVARRLAVSGFGVAPLNTYTVAVSQPHRALKILPGSTRHAITETTYLVTRKRRWPNPLAEYLVKTFQIPAP